MFGALLEYSVILLRIKIYSLQQCPSNIDVNNGAGGGNNSAPGNNSHVPHALPINSVHSDSFKVMKKNQLVARFDLFCLVFFPILFLLFTSVYTLVIVLV